MTRPIDIEVVYDKECPVCEFYCNRIDVKESVGCLVRIDARADSEIMDDITALGLDIDEGMVVRIGDQLYYGSDAIHELALLSSDKGFVNFMARLTFGSRSMARMFYPFFRFVRNMLLKLLGKSRINNLREPGKDRF
jgi:predicted DCC family thiol-disulfide oxidoreductase YuxK